MHDNRTNHGHYYYNPIYNTRPTKTSPEETALAILLTVGLLLVLILANLATK